MRLGTIIGLVLVIMLVGVALWLYTPDKKRSELEARYLGADDRYVEIAGLRLRVRETGPKAAPAVILLHGFGDSLETWEAWARTLSADHRVARFDLPGFGLTGADPMGDYGDARALSVLLGLMDALAIQRASLIGNSLGGKLAWKCAAAHPDRVEKLVLVSPDGFASPGFAYGRKAEVPFLLRLLPYTLPKSMVTASLAPAYGDPAGITDALVTRYRDMLLAPGVRAAMLDRMEQVMLVDPAPDLARVTAPTLLVWGVKDGMIPFTNAADYTRAITGSRLVALDGLGHVPQEEAPATSIVPVKTFLGP